MLFAIVFADSVICKMLNSSMQQFYSVASTWQSCLYAPTDFKELVPEFYSFDLSQKGSFLTNHLQLDLGFRDGGKPIGDVELPPWSNGSVETFINYMGAALESQYGKN